MRKQSAKIPNDCKNCIYMNCCRGGLIPMRYSFKNGYDNKSVYCEDYKEIFSYAWKIIREEISLKKIR